MFKKALLVSAVALAVSAPAHALVQVSNFDWTTPFGTFNDVAAFTITGFKSATVTQELNSSGQVFAGAHFSEFGAAYSVGFTNAVGDPVPFGTNLFLTFSGLSGVVTSVNSDGSFSYAFNPVGTISVSYGATSATATSWLTLPVVGINGSGANSLGLNTKGTSEVLGVLPTDTTLTSFKDESNNSLNWFQTQGGLFIDTVTTNTIAANNGVVRCDYGVGACASLTVSSTGDATLYRIPEPATLGLLGLGLVGLGAMRRRKA